MGMEMKELAKKFDPEYLESIQRLRLMDDDFMSMVFSADKQAAEVVLRVIMGNDALVVDSVQVQEEIKGVRKRSIRMDAHIRDVDDTHYNVEIQRQDKGAAPRRARFYLGLLDSANLNPGEDFDKLPETYIIFITERDVLGHSLPLYHIERVIQETGEFFQDGEHIIFANGAYQGDDPVGRLMADFRTPRPEEMHYPPLAKTAEYFKNHEEGVATMCKEMEKFRDKGIKEGMAEGLAMGMAKGEDIYAHRLNRLYEALVSAGREDEFLRAAISKENAAPLLKEFGI